MEKRNATKAKLIYDAIDNSNGFYKGTVEVKAARSHMNVTYRLPSEELTDEFVKSAARTAWSASRATAPSAASAPASTTPCRSKGAKALAEFMGTFAKANG